MGRACLLDVCAVSVPGCYAKLEIKEEKEGRKEKEKRGGQAASCAFAALLSLLSMSIFPSCAFAEIFQATLCRVTIDVDSFYCAPSRASIAVLMRTLPVMMDTL